MLELILFDQLYDTIYGMGYIKITLVAVLTCGILILNWSALDNIVKGRGGSMNEYITLATTTPMILLVIYYVCNDRFSR